MKESSNKNKAISEFDIESIIENKLMEIVEDRIKPNHKIELRHSKVHPHRPHLPEHIHIELKVILNIEDQIDVLINVFGDESTAEAVIKIMNGSPIEIQVIAKLIVDLYEKLSEFIEE